eukprot:GDKK01011159.1.p2 GENE.GDKK01011159.1~~GDKK01011159.1.p2  ORF type:complete len:174 (+),score=5.22 GDKK01011159.1:472-993(+)
MESADSDDEGLSSGFLLGLGGTVLVLGAGALVLVLTVVALELVGLPFGAAGGLGFASTVFGVSFTTVGAWTTAGGTYFTADGAGGLFRGGGGTSSSELKLSSNSGALAVTGDLIGGRPRLMPSSISRNSSATTRGRCRPRLVGPPSSWRMSMSGKNVLLFWAAFLSLPSHKKP